MKVVMLVCDKCSDTSAGTYAITYGEDTWEVDLCSGCSSVLYPSKVKGPANRGRPSKRARFTIVDLPDDPDISLTGP